MHLFGHIHGGYGVMQKGETTFINAAIWNKRNPGQVPFVFDLPKRESA